MNTWTIVKKRLFFNITYRKNLSHNVISTHQPIFPPSKLCLPSQYEDVACNTRNVTQRSYRHKIIVPWDRGTLGHQLEIFYGLRLVEASKLCEIVYTLHYIILTILVFPRCNWPPNAKCVTLFEPGSNPATV